MATDNRTTEQLINDSNVALQAIERINAGTSISIAHAVAQHARERAEYEARVARTLALTAAEVDTTQWALRALLTNLRERMDGPNTHAANVESYRVVCERCTELLNRLA